MYRNPHSPLPFLQHSYLPPQSLINLHDHYLRLPTLRCSFLSTSSSAIAFSVVLFLNSQSSSLKAFSIFKPSSGFLMIYPPPTSTPHRHPTVSNPAPDQASHSRAWPLQPAIYSKYSYRRLKPGRSMIHRPTSPCPRRPLGASPIIMSAIRFLPKPSSTFRLYHTY